MPALEPTLLSPVLDADQCPPALRSYFIGMVTREECITLCGLTSSEVTAIAEHEHVSAATAAALGQHLLKQRRGREQVCQMIIDDIRLALLAGNTCRAAQFLAALQHILTVDDRPDDGAREASL